MDLGEVCERQGELEAGWWRRDRPSSAGARLGCLPFGRRSVECTFWSEVFDLRLWIWRCSCQSILWYLSYIWISFAGAWANAQTCSANGVSFEVRNDRPRLPGSIYQSILPPSHSIFVDMGLVLVEYSLEERAKIAKYIMHDRLIACFRFQRCR